MDIEAETETDTEQRQRRRRRRRQRQRQTGNQSIMAAATEAGRELRDKVAQHPGQPSPQPVGEWVRVVRRWCHWCSRHLCAGGGCKEGGREEEGRKGGRGQEEGLRAGHARVGVLKCKSAGTVACRHQAGEWSLVTGHWSLVTGHWSLVTGHWSLVTGHWSLVTPPLTPHRGHSPPHPSPPTPTSPTLSLPPSICRHQMEEDSGVANKGVTHPAIKILRRQQSCVQRAQRVISCIQR